MSLKGVLSAVVGSFARIFKAIINGVAEVVKPKYNILAVRKSDGKMWPFSVRGSTNEEILLRTRVKLHANDDLVKKEAGKYETTEYSISFAKAMPKSESFRRFQGQMRQFGGRGDAVINEAYGAAWGRRSQNPGAPRRYSITAKHKHTGETKSFAVVGQTRDETIISIAKELGVDPHDIKRVEPNHLETLEWDIRAN